MKFQSLKKPNQICSSDLDIQEKSDIIIDANDQLIERLVSIFQCISKQSFYLISCLILFKGIQLDEIEGLRKKTETELKLTTIYTTNRNINTSWNKDVFINFIYY